MRIPFAGAIALYLITLLADLYIGLDIKNFTAPKHRKTWLWVHIVISLLFLAYLTVIIMLPKRDPEDSVIPVMWMLFSYLSVYLSKLIYCICSIIGRLVRLGFRRKSHINYGAMVGLPLAILVFITIWWGALFTRYDIETTEVTVESDRLPASFDGLKAIQFSDLHSGTWGNDTSFVSKLVDSINARKPDVIFFTGDIVNRRSNELDPFLKPLSRLKAPHGVIAIHGNHDYSSYVDWPNPGDMVRDVARLDSMIRSMGWKLLNNAHTYIVKGNDSIPVIGVENWGEPPFGQFGNLHASYAASDSTRHVYDDHYKILLTHNPEHWSMAVIDTSNVDLSLAGHTHAMQMMIKIGDWKWSPSKYRYSRWGGMYRETSKDGRPMDLYVNIGVGEVGFPARIGATPEITEFTFKSTRK